jgi:hypothetical protein
LKKREEFAISLRKQKRQEIIQKKRRQINFTVYPSPHKQEDQNKDALIDQLAP